VLVVVGDEGQGDHIEMHDQFHRRHIGPFQRQHQLLQPQRARPEEGLAVEGDHVGTVDVVAHVLLAQVLELGVATAAQPAADIAGPFVVPGHAENGAMGEFVDQVGGDDHAVGQQQRAQRVQPAVTGEQQGQTAAVGERGVEDRQGIGQASIGVAVQGFGSHGLLQHRRAMARPASAYWASASVNWAS